MVLESVIQEPTPIDNFNKTTIISSNVKITEVYIEK